MNTESKKINILLELHTEFSRVPILFRERICDECNYSTATFYRKMQSNDRRVDGKLVPVLSDAEKEKIRDIAEDVANSLSTSIFGVKEK